MLCHLYYIKTHYHVQLCTLKDCHFYRLKISNGMTVIVCAFMTQVFDIGANNTCSWCNLGTILEHDVVYVV
jgi:hypothetical protein